MMQINISKGIVLTILILWTSLHGADNFLLVRQMNYDEEIYGRFMGSIFDKDNNLICSFYKKPLCLFTTEKVVTFAHQGQGPDELINLFARCRYKDDIALFEMSNKIKIFTQKKGSYVWKETKWLKSGYYISLPREVIFFEDKWFIAGSHYHDMGGKNAKVSFVRIYDDKGIKLKDLITKQFENPRMFVNMTFFITRHKDRLFFLPEDELKVSVISSKELKVIKEVVLETPKFYKSIPADFYTFKNYDKPGEGIMKDIEYWKGSYSRILKLDVEDGYLVLQFRVFDENLKKFALLFYNADSFKLEKTIFTDDCFLGAKNGKYYFYANGDPGFDEEADKCIINVYSFEGKR